MFNSNRHKEKCEDITQGRREHSDQIRCKLHLNLLSVLSPHLWCFS